MTNTRNNFKQIFISAIIIIFIDSLYLTLIGGPIFSNTVRRIQNDDMNINVLGAILSYLLIILSINKFILLEDKVPSEAFVLGFCIYGIFDFTNLAIFKKYDFSTAIVDMIWGGILFYVTTLLTYKITKN